MPQPDRIFLTAPAVVSVGAGGGSPTKVANAMTHSLSVRTNSQKTPTNDGLVISKGFYMGDVTIATMETVDGQQNRLIRALFANDIITVAFAQGGLTIVVQGTFDEMSKNSITERGTTEGNYKVSGSVKVF